MRAIAIDGPTGAGKSTMARELAKRLGYVHADTGALYRAIGYHMLCHSTDISNEDAVEKMLRDVSVELRYTDGESRVFLNSKDISEHIRSEEVSMAASAVSAYPAVRAFLLGLQRKIAENSDVIMDGRDIGTVVLPSAALKLFLTASQEDRAMRRYVQLTDSGQEADYCAVLRDLKTRDHNDSHRKAAPLTPAEDAVIVDTTGRELKESIELIMKIVGEKFLI